MNKKHLLLTLLLAFVVGIGNAWGADYTYSSFATTFYKGTKNGTDISTQVQSTTMMTTIANSGAANFSIASVSNCYYNTSGAGIRISKSSGAGSITFNLSDALKDSTIYAIVVFASKVANNTKAILDVTPAGGYSTPTNYSNSTLKDYSSSTIATYKLDTIKVGGKQLTSITFASASGGYTMLHGITLVTQTELAAKKPGV